MATQWIGRCEFCNAKMYGVVRRYSSLCIRCGRAMRKATGEQSKRPKVYRTRCSLCVQLFKSDGYTRCKECRQ